MFGSFTELLTSLIAEWYSVWQEVTQVKQGLALLVLGWVTACYRCLDSTCSALTQLLQTACEVTNGQISRSELNGTIKRWGHEGCNAFDTTTWYRSYYTIMPLTPKKRSFPESHDPKGLIEKNPGRNAN